MQLLLNGELKTIPSEGSAVPLPRLLNLLAVPVEATAVAVNQEVIPRSDWERTVVRENDKVEIIRAAAGG